MKVYRRHIISIILRTGLLINAGLLEFAYSQQPTQQSLALNQPKVSEDDPNQISNNKPSIGETKSNVNTNSLLFNPASYKASYTVDLDRTTYFDIGIKDVKGTLEIVVANRNNEWHLVQKSTIFVYFKDKDKADRYEYVIRSVEGQNGLNYHFRIKSNINNNEDLQEYEGTLKYPEHLLPRISTATMQQIDTKKALSNRYIQFTKPDYARSALGKDVFLPRQHLHHMIQNALRGQTELRHQQVFDGANDSKEVVEIDSQLTPQPNFAIKTTVAEENTNLTNNLRPAIENNQIHADQNNSLNTSSGPTKAFAEKLSKSMVWKAKLNMFEKGERISTEPDYVYFMHVNDMGIILGMKYKYMDPEFTVKLSLKECESVDPNNVSTAALNPFEESSSEILDGASVNH